jgi:hypothetical protein
MPGRLLAAGPAVWNHAELMFRSRIIASYSRGKEMKLAGLGLLVSGCIVAVAALCLLPQLALRAGFVVAGLLVEGLGLFLVGRAHLESLGARE